MIRIVKSISMSDNPKINGGCPDLNSPVISGQKFNLLPRVTADERVGGKIISRKIYLYNDSNKDYDSVSLCISKPTNGGDEIYIKKAFSCSETEILLTDDGWTGAGILYEDIPEDGNEIKVVFKSLDYNIPQGCTIFVRDDYGYTKELRTSNVIPTKWEEINGKFVATIKLYAPLKYPMFVSDNVTVGIYLTHYNFSAKSVAGFWVKEVVPAGCQYEPDNGFNLDWAAE